MNLLLEGLTQTCVDREDASQKIDSLLKKSLDEPALTEGIVATLSLLCVGKILSPEEFGRIRIPLSNTGVHHPAGSLYIQ